MKTVYEFILAADADPEIKQALEGAHGAEAVARIAADRGFAFKLEELERVVALLRFLADASRNQALCEELAQARDAAAVVELAHRHGYDFSAEELAHLGVGAGNRALNERELDNVVGGSVQRQTPQTDFASLVTKGVAAPFIPGGQAVTAAVTGLK